MRRSLAFAVSAQAICILLLLVLAWQFFKQLNTLSDYTSKVEHTYRVINQLSRVQSYLKDAETSTRGFLLTRKPEFLVLLNQSKNEILPSIDSLRKLLEDSPSQLSLLKDIQQDAYEKIRMQLENARMRISADSLLTRVAYGRVVMERVEANIDVMRRREFTLLAERAKSQKESESALPSYVRKAFFLTGLFTLVFGLWIFIELKKRFRYQQLLQHKLMELRQNNEELEQIAFAASHDLQEPLRKIRIFSDRLLIRTKVDEGDENYHMTKRINLAATRLQSLISDLVTFNRLVQNNYSEEIVSISNILAKVVKVMQQKLPELTVEVCDKNLPEIKGSEEQVSILFQHLFSNAIQFRSDKRPARITIINTKVKWSEIKGLPVEITAGEFFHMQVKDNGIGFDETYKNKMFKPFQRLHNLDTEVNNRRKGMGLAMCKRVMLNLGGWIDATSELGEGATIHLYFPAA